MLRCVFGGYDTIRTITCCTCCTLLQMKEEREDGCSNALCDASLPYMQHCQYIAVALPSLPNLRGLFYLFRREPSLKFRKNRNEFGAFLANPFLHYHMFDRDC